MKKYTENNKSTMIIMVLLMSLILILTSKVYSVKADEAERYVDPAGTDMTDDIMDDITVENGELLPLPVSERKDGDLTWSIDKYGHLTIRGKGNYKNADWKDYRYQIESVEVHVSDITSTAGMFQWLFFATEIDVSDLDTSKVTDMSYMFQGCRSLYSVDFSGHDFGAVTSEAGLNSMFWMCDLLTSVKLPDKKTGPIKNISRMFSNCISIESIDLSSLRLDTNVDMSELVAESNSLDKIVFPEAELNEPNMTDMFKHVYYMKECDFSGLSLGEKVVFPELAYSDKIIWPAGAKISVVLDNDTTDDYVWKDDAGNIVSETEKNLTVSKTYTYYRPEEKQESSDAIVSVSGNSAGLYWGINDQGLLTISGQGDFGYDEDGDGRDLPWLKYSNSIKKATIEIDNITSINEMFYDCDKLEEIDFSNSDLSKVESLESTFHNCKVLKKIIWDANIKKPIRMNYTFYNCETLENIEFDSFDMSNLSMIQGIFSGCKNMKSIDVLWLKDVDLSGFNMQDVFNGCSSLESVDLSGLNRPDTSYYIMQNMFCYCESLKQIDLSGLKPDEFSQFGGMFYGCTSLEKVILPEMTLNMRTINNQNSTVRMFQNCTSLKELDFSMVSIEKLEDECFFLWTLNGCNNLEKIKVSAELPTTMMFPFTEGFHWEDEEGNSVMGAHMHLPKAATYIRKSDEQEAPSITPSPNPVNTNTDKQTDSQQDQKETDNNLAPKDGNKNNQSEVTIKETNKPDANGNVFTKETGVPEAKKQVLQDSKLSYQVSNASAKSPELTVTGIKNSSDKTISVPATVKLNGVTYKVTSIAQGAYKNDKSVTKVIIGKNIKSIGKEAFKGCKKLKRIEIKSTKLKASSVQKNWLKGTKKNLVIKVPKKKYAAYKKFLTKCGNKTVKIKK